MWKIKNERKGLKAKSSEARDKTMEYGGKAKKRDSNEQKN